MEYGIHLQEASHLLGTDDLVHTSFDVASKFAPIPRSNTQVTNTQAPRRTEHEPGSLLRVQKKKPPAGFHRKQDTYVRARRAAEQQGEQHSAVGCPSGCLSGLGLWRGSNEIPGSLRAKASMTDVIELPKRMPRRVTRKSPMTVPGSRARAQLNKEPSRPFQLPLLFEPSGGETGPSRVAAQGLLKAKIFRT